MFTKKYKKEFDSKGFFLIEKFYTEKEVKKIKSLLRKTDKKKLSKHRLGASLSELKILDIQVFMILFIIKN